MHRVLLKTSPIFITNPLFEFRNNSRNIRILIAPNYYSRERSDTSITHSFFFEKRKHSRILLMKKGVEGRHFFQPS